MKQSLQLRLGQHLAMTPQLQQAIRLLQLSTMELQTEIQDALDSNMMLEVDEADDVEPRDGGVESLDGTEIAPADIPTDLPTDSAWEDVYDAAATPSGPAGDGGGEFEGQRGAVDTLKDHLFWQMGLMRFSENDLLIGAAIIDAIDDDGYLGASLEDIRASVAGEYPEATVEEVEACLHQIHNLDPPGVGARSLSECLAIQLLQYPVETEWRAQALELVSEHIDVLGAKDFAQLQRMFKVDTEALQEIIGLVRSLTPRPGALLDSASAEYVIPDVYVRKERGAWRVDLNPDAFPRLRVNSQYAGFIKRADSSSDNMTLRAHLQEARWFIKSLRSRSETLLKVSRCIVERQREFLEYGAEAMKPMVLADVAEAVGMHESTISRVTTQKYMHTPRGIYELKYFFSSHVYTNNGAECSSTAIRALLKKLIAAENPGKPLSDSKLASILSEQGIKVARRTVAKYREGMSIPSSSERKNLV